MPPELRRPALIPATVLLTLTPAIWLASDCGALGIAVAVLGTAVAAATPQLFHAAIPHTLAGWAEQIIPPFSAIALAMVAHGLSRVLQENRRALLEQRADLELQILTMNEVLQSVAAAVVVLQPGQTPVLNDRAQERAKRAGLAPEDPTGQPATRMYRHRAGHGPLEPEDQPLARAMRGESFDSFLHWVGEPGHEVALVTSARQILDADGVRRGSVLSAWDATEVMESLRVCEEFLATVSHELRTPLTSIIGYVEILRDAGSQRMVHRARPRPVGSSERVTR